MPLLSDRPRWLRHPALPVDPRQDGYQPLDQVANSFLFQLVSKALHQGSIILASNMSYSERGADLGDEVAAAAGINRLLHFSTTVNLRGESYRLKDKKQTSVFTIPSGLVGNSRLWDGLRAASGEAF